MVAPMVPSAGNPEKKASMSIHCFKNGSLTYCRDSLWNESRMYGMSSMTFGCVR